MKISQLKNIIGECIEEYKSESFSRNPFNIKKFTMLYKYVDSIFKSIDFQNPKNEPIKTTEGEFTQSQYLLNDIIRAIQVKDRNVVEKSLVELDKIIDSDKLIGKNIDSNKLTKYEEFKNYLRNS